MYQWRGSSLAAGRPDRHAFGMPENPSPDVFLEAFAGAPVRTLGAGEVLIAAGATATEVFNILSGMLMVSRTGHDGRRQVLSFLFRDNFVGLTATDHYFFTVEAVTESQVVCCSRASFTKRLMSDPRSEHAFVNMMFRVLEDMLDQVYSLGQRTAVERLAVFLLYLRHWRKLSEDIPDDIDPRLREVRLPMTREDIADFLGLQKETVSRSFRQLEERGLIAREHSGSVQLQDLGALRELAGILDFAAPARLIGRRRAEL
jgi:CRP/FNR family transcriptional regulator